MVLGIPLLIVASMTCLLHLAQHYAYLGARTQVLLDGPDFSGSEAVAFVPELLAGARQSRAAKDIVRALFAGETATGALNNATIIIGNCQLKFMAHGQALLDKCIQVQQLLLQDLVDTLASDSFREFSTRTEKELTQDNVNALLGFAKTKESVAFFTLYKQHKKNKGTPKDLQHQMQDLANILELPLDGNRVQEYSALAEMHSKALTTMMGQLTAVQTLFRELKPGEARASLAKKLRAGLEADNMEIGVMFQLAVQNACEPAVSTTGKI